ncbi:hypothetical protein BGM09_01055 [Streptomyces sp. CBMA29]|nr:hypothetical protein [Streptomyces sp. CBMA29]
MPAEIFDACFLQLFATQSHSHKYGEDRQASLSGNGEAYFSCGSAFGDSADGFDLVRQQGLLDDLFALVS